MSEDERSFREFGEATLGGLLLVSREGSRSGLPLTFMDRFLDDFILDAIEKNGLAFGGGINCGFITTWKRGSASEAHRTIVENWLSGRREVVSVTLGPLIDAWYPEAERPPLV